MNTYFKDRYEELKAAGLCVECGKEKSIEGKTRCKVCRDKTAESSRARTRKRTADLKDAGRCTACGKQRPIKGEQKCISCKMKQRERVNSSNAKLRDEVFQQYGGYRCSCCNELKDPKFMQLDHVNNDGAEHRRSIFGVGRGGGTRFYRWLKKSNFPFVVQPMCADCNSAKGFYGECPHVKQQGMLLSKLAKIGLTY